MTAFQSLLFILNARYSSFHMFFKPPSLNLKISDQAILGRTSTWTYTTIHTTYGSTDTRRCGFYFSLEMLQNSTKKTLFGLSIGAHHGVSNRTIFEPPSGTDDAGHWRSAGRIRMYVNVVFYYYPPPATMAHTLHPLTPLFLSSTLLTVYMEMRLSLQKVLFADIPFVRSSLAAVPWWTKEEGMMIWLRSQNPHNFSPGALYVRISIDGSSSQKKAPSVPDFSVRYDHHKKTQERSLRKEVGGVVVIRAQRYYTTLRLVLHTYYTTYYLTMHVDRSATQRPACMMLVLLSPLP